MKPSSLRLAIASALSLIALPHASMADVVVMKDGKKYESATVLSETADSVTFKYMLTPRIPDTRTEPKANIAQIIKQRPEELAILPLRKLVPTEDLLSADKYEGIIQDQLRPFVSQFPGTAEAKEVEAMIATYEAEKAKVTGGQLKMDGQWLTPEVVKRETRNIEAYRHRMAMNAAAAKNEWVAALTEWDKLNDREEGFVDTEQYVQAAPEAQKILEGYKQLLERMLAEQPQLQSRRDKAVVGLVEPDLSRTKKAIADEVAKFKNINDLEKKTRVHWMTIYKYDAKGIQAAAKTVVDELAKIATLDLTKLKATNEAITAARRYLADQNIELAEAAVAKAAEAAGRSSNVSTAITKLKSEITKVKSELGKKRATQRLYGNSGALTGETTETSDRVAKAMEDSAKDKADKKAAKEEEKDAPVAKATGGLSAGSKGASSTSTRSSSSSSSDEAAESDGGLQKYLIIGGAALLAILLGAMFIQKKK